MATVTTRGISLSQTATLGSKRSDVVCVATATRYKRDPETRQATESIEGYAVNVLSAKGEPQTVKLPIDSAPVVNQIHDALNEDKLVRVSFEKWVGKFWAMLDSNTGRINQGVSVNASAISVVSIEDPEEDFDILDDVEI